jgi:hypothetical protein
MELRYNHSWSEMKRDLSRWEIVFAVVVFTAGLALRLRLALLTYFNADEALHSLWAFGTWGETLRNAPADTHPPLLLFITYAVSQLSRTELALRLVPVLAGSLFPLLLFVWLRRVSGRMAAMAVLVLLTLAPHFITISAQVRSYTLAFLFLSASLLVLEEALQGDSWIAMAVYSLFLCLCISSDYSMAWFVAAVGVYALLRLRGTSTPVKTTWLVGQLGALLLYGVLFVFQIRRHPATEWQGWLSSGFPQPGKMLIFPFAGTLKQFAFLMASIPIGALVSVLFAVAVFWLWTGRTGIELRRARALAALLVLPFVFAIAGAYAREFPYGRTRHTLVLGIFGALGIAIFVEKLPRRLAIALLGVTLFLTPLWEWKADLDLEDIRPDRNQKELMLHGLDYMRATIPAGSLIFTEIDTLTVLAYYDGHNRPYRPPPGQFTETTLGGRWRIAAVDYQFLMPDTYRPGLAAFRRRYGLAESEPVWVVDGGWTVAIAPPDERRPFTRAVQVIQTGAH